MSMQAQTFKQLRIIDLKNWIQEVKDVVLIRHAYTLTSYQNKGAGSALIKYLLKKK